MQLQLCWRGCFTVRALGGHQARRLCSTTTLLLQVGRNTKLHARHSSLPGLARRSCVQPKPKQRERLQGEQRRLQRIDWL